MDPSNVVVWVRNLETVLGDADPANRDAYRKRAEAYSDQLRRLDASIGSRLAQIPGERTLVTDHQVLGWYAARYGLVIAGTVLPGSSTSREASIRQTADLVELLRRERVRSVLIGSTAGRGLENLAVAVAEELKEDVQILEILTGSLAQTGRPGDTYLRYMEYNTQQILRALSR
jgi:zinc/manganese transport system substrate-binding protein/manganese/iron transport system substrate-binding protein